MLLSNDKRWSTLDVVHKSNPTSSYMISLTLMEVKMRGYHASGCYHTMQTASYRFIRTETTDKALGAFQNVNFWKFD